LLAEQVTGWAKNSKGNNNNLKVRIASNEGLGYDEVLMQFCTQQMG
jgi:hypothetical protein